MKYKVVILGSLLLFVASCSPASYLGQRFDDFTAYYNTFYNARKAFQEGLKAMENPDQPVDLLHYLPLFPEPSGRTRHPAFEQAIKKSADLLRKHPRSRWVDDAVLLIGKSYYYQQNYVGAEQKFREVLEMDSPLAPEARFWLARTLMASKLYEEARAVLEEGLLQPDIPKKWRGIYQLMLGELYVHQALWEEAVQALTQGLTQVADKSLKARAQFLLGQVYETIGAYDKAIEAYARVQKYHPPYELAYAAQVSQIRVMGLHGDWRKALALLKKMERDDKHYSRLALLELLRAQILQAHGQTEEALAIYHELLYGEEARDQSVKGEVHYRLAELYRDAYRDFQRAAAHFDTAAVRLKRMVPGELVTPVAITDASSEAKVFKDFQRVAQRIAEMDSLLYLGMLPPAAFDSVVLALRRRRAQELALQQAEVERRQAEAQFQQSGARVTSQEESEENSRRFRDELLAAGNEENTYGFLFYKNPVLVRENQEAFKRIWGDRPLVPGWRVASAIVQNPTELLAEADTLNAIPDWTTEALPEIDLSRIPREASEQLNMRRRRAYARYELANILFLSMQEPDSAAAWYRRIMEEDAEFKVAQRALYALAEVYRAKGDTARARQLYREVAERYPNTSLALRAKERLGEAPISQEKNDSLEEAEKKYALAYQAWQEGRYREALQRMLAIVKEYPGTEVYARARLAAGLIALEAYHRGEPSLLYQLGTSEEAANAPEQVLALWYEELIDEYTETPYGVRAEQILAGLKEEALLAQQAADSSWVAAETTAVSTPDTSLVAFAQDKDSSAVAVAESQESLTESQESLTESQESTGAVTAVENAPESPQESTPASVSSDVYVWVVASLPDREQAERVASHYRMLGYADVMILPVLWKHGYRYRVSIGRFSTVKEAHLARSSYPDLPADTWLLRYRVTPAFPQVGPLAHQRNLTP